MANIYKQQQTSDLAHRYYSAEGNFGQKMLAKGEEYEREAEKHEAKAKDTYSKAINLTWQSSVNELLNNPKYNANPEGMKAELQKINESIGSQIVDDDVKLDFLVNSEISGQTYINNAQKNFQRVQEEKRRSAIFDSVYASLDLASTAMSNILSGNGTSDDALNFEESRKKALNNINARDEYGNYIFSDTQRLRMTKDIDDYALESFKNTYESLDASQQDILADKILNNKNFDILYKDGTLPVNPNNAISEKMLRDIKNYIGNYIAVRMANEDRYSYEKLVSQYGAQNELNEAFEDLDPIKALNLLEENKSKVSQKFYNAKIKQLKENAGISAETEAETFTDLLMQANSIDKDRLSNEEIINAQNDVLDNIEEAYAEKKLKPSDRRTLLAMLNKEQGKRLPDLIDDKSSGWSWFGYNYEDAQKAFRKTLTNSGKVSQAMLEYHRTLSENPKATSIQKRDLVRTIANKYNAQALDDAVTVGKVAKGDDNVVNWQEYFKE